MWIGRATVEKSMDVPQETKTRSSILFSSPTPRHISNKSIIQKDLCSILKFTAALFPIAKAWKQMSSDRWTDKEDVIHMLRGYLKPHSGVYIKGFLKLKI